VLNYESPVEKEEATKFEKQAYAPCFLKAQEQARHTEKVTISHNSKFHENNR